LHGAPPYIFLNSEYQNSEKIAIPLYHPNPDIEKIDVANHED
jgi:hypothetical protein